mmetsp:Transcript_10087/g.29913  ORF Transcript_10087/g.29913 Transcript_10087/m.29913 type:complete len:91 (+) Transcript_10087:626-898(+)
MPIPGLVQQIWWSSPLSGPKRFEFDGEAWRNTRDNGELGELLHAEVCIQLEPQSNQHAFRARLNPYVAEPFKVKETVGVELPPLEDFLDG